MANVNLEAMRLTRRDLQRGVAGGAALAAGGRVSAARAAQDTSVYALMDPTFMDVGAGPATEVYNQENPDQPQIVLEEAGPGWDAKVLPQVQDNNLRWSGNGYLAFFDLAKYIRAGIVAPLDDLLAASSVPWAAQQEDIYFTPRIYEAQLYEGQQYYIPMKANVHVAGWRQDYLEAAGYETLPRTWTEIEEMLPKIKEAMAEEEVIPFSIQRDLWRAVGTTFATFVPEPLDEQGVFRIDTPEWIEVLEMFTRWIANGWARFDANDIAVDAWQKGGFAFSLSSHSWVRLGRQVWGPELVRGGVPPQASLDEPARTWAHIDSACVFNNAPNPQAATDWALSIYGPEGAPAETWWSGTLSFSGSPVFQSMIDKYVTDNAEISEVGEVLELVPNCQIPNIEQTNGYNICQLVLPPFLDQVFSGELSAQEAMTQARAAIDAEFAKQL